MKEKNEELNAELEKHKNLRNQALEASEMMKPSANPRFWSRAGYAMGVG
jgi:hypothetical protein